MEGHPLLCSVLQDSCWLTQSEWSRLPGSLKGALEASHPTFSMIYSKKYQSILILRTGAFSYVHFCFLFKEQKQNLRKSVFMPRIGFLFQVLDRPSPTKLLMPLLFLPLLLFLSSSLAPPPHFHLSMPSSSPLLPFLFSSFPPCPSPLSPSHSVS